VSAIILLGADRPFGAEIATRLAHEGELATELPPTGAIEALVINVPVVREGTRFGEITDAQLEEALEAMVFDVVAAVQQALPRLAPGARIVAVAARGHLGAWGGAHLMAANAALAGFIRSIALELGERGIRANLLAPDFAGERWDTPKTRAEVAEAAAFLAAPGMALMNGQTLLLDGMRSMRLTESRRPQG
jgi:3-oxoacyl-[acyl-carrier protein] reductase